MRPLLLEFPDDRATFSLNDEWMLGDRVLAAPVLTKDLGDHPKAAIDDQVKSGHREKA
jgi:alpha-glucosidase (family GH31 glycosyl hydrolase)